MRAIPCWQRELSSGNCPRNIIDFLLSGFYWSFTLSEQNKNASEINFFRTNLYILNGTPFIVFNALKYNRIPISKTYNMNEWGNFFCCLYRLGGFSHSFMNAADVDLTKTALGKTDKNKKIEFPSLKGAVISISIR